MIFDLENFVEDLTSLVLALNSD